MVLYVTDELSYDKYYPKSERTYRVTASGALNGNNFDLAVVGAAAAAVGQALVKNYPQVEQFARFRDSDSRFIRFGEESALDKVLKVGGTEGFKITGVFKDTSKNTHFDFNVLGSMETLDEAK